VDFLPGNAQCCHFTVSGLETGLTLEFKGDADVHCTSWLAAGALVSIPAQAASKDRQLMTIRVRSALKEKKGGDVVMKKMAGNRGGCQACGLDARRKTKNQTTQRGARGKVSKNCTAFSIKKAASGFPEAAFGFS